MLHTCIANNALSQGKQIHSLIIHRGFAFATRTFFQNKLIDMYVKCGSLVNARRVFDEMTERDGFSWNVIIAAYRKHGFPHEALTLFNQMNRTGVQPDQFTFASILPACAILGALEQGMYIHRSIIESGILSNVVVASALIDMYTKCGSVQKARELFDKMPQRNVISWNVMMVGYAHSGNLDEAIKLFKEMPQRDVVSWNLMIAAYAQNGVFDEALRLFKEMPQPDVVSWNTMIAGYAQNGYAEKALETFGQMQLAGVTPNPTTFASILPACAKMGALEQGMDIHESILGRGLFLDVVIASALVDMYAKCGSINVARQLFDKMSQRDAVSWNAMIAGYAQNGDLDEALKLFKEMPQRDKASWNVMIAGYAQNGLVEKALDFFKQMQLAGVLPNSTTFASILLACAKIGALGQGMDIHQSIIGSGLLSDVVVVSALIDMYVKCGEIQKACELFDKMSKRDTITWNAMIAGFAKNGDLDEALKLFKEMPQQDVASWNVMIAGYTQNGLVEKALEFFKQMLMAGVQPDQFTFASILPACAKMGAFKQGMDIHQSAIESGFLSDVVVASALVDMYAKCGSTQKAREIFNKMSQRDAVSWNAMIAGYAIHGFHKDALKLFELLKHSGTYPDHVSFLCVLFACSHAGLVDDGCKYFYSMGEFYCIMPTMDHYVCMVDLLGRAGDLGEALNFIIKMPIKPPVIVWLCLLGACRSHKNIGLGISIASLLFDLDPKNAASYVLLSNIYAEVGRWDDVQKVRRLMKDGGIKKIPGCSWIEVHKMVHAFCVGDKSHPQTVEIYAMLAKLSREMMAEGYFPDSGHVLNDVEEEEKELFLCHHSEKLAIAFGLLNTSPGTTIRVVKNLRVCVDCHTATKFISKIVAREIVVRDANRFHHFKKGQCSCRDYW
ncbi:hypothetical protein KI387_029234 [Taxus chinensis]|uniref:DYW domain-containing protein n=1 Tax=Taxus chinensis TaxID=29808 RepID=A0AA38FDA6_TAXCH|nr:hypothetical protein KI387_029234 [Taxus chinensis]